MASGDHDFTTEINAGALNTDGLQCFHPCQYQQTVTEFIQDSFDTFRFDAPIDRLYAWLSLYKVVNAKAQKGFVHRDLSWKNFHLFRPRQDSLLSVIIIDFDLASIIKSSSSRSPEQTGQWLSCQLKSSLALAIELSDTKNSTGTNLHFGSVFWLSTTVPYSAVDVLLGSPRFTSTALGV